MFSFYHRLTMLGTLISILSFSAANASNMPESGQTATPIGYLMYCLKFRQDCNRRAISYAHENIEDLMHKVQTSVNLHIRPTTDMRNYRKADHWTIPTNGRGDCEDFALAKRVMLLKAGLPASSLLLASAINERGEPHMVLIVRTKKQDYVLDNTKYYVKKWQELPYTWVSIQDMKNPMRWKKPDLMMVAQLQGAEQKRLEIEG